MSRLVSSFLIDPKIESAVGLIRDNLLKADELPLTFPESGLGEALALDLLAPYVIGKAAHLDAPHALANMDPPTPWITWVIALWNARLNQNLLHPSTAPFAKDAERRVIAWLSPFFGMQGGHMCSGSTLANLTALWVARDVGNIEKVVASEASHLSIRKAAQILRIPYEEIATTRRGRLDVSKINDISNACLVLNTGTTATGAIDDLTLAGRSKWTHIDAAWGGPLRLSSLYAKRLSGIEKADSVSVSCHKLLMQPKDSALVMFRDISLSNSAISFGSGYLAEPNVGIQGSRAAAANVLFGTLLALGRAGFEELINHLIKMADLLAERLSASEEIELLCTPSTGVVVFRPLNQDTQMFYEELPSGMFSTCVIREKKWLRAVAANPLADIDLIMENVSNALRQLE